MLCMTKRFCATQFSLNDLNVQSKCSILSAGWSSFIYKFVQFCWNKAIVTEDRLGQVTRTLCSGMISPRTKTPAMPFPGTKKSWDARSWDNRSWDNRSWDARSLDARSRDLRSWDLRSWDLRSWDLRSWDLRSWDLRSWDLRSWDLRAWDARSWDVRSFLSPGSRDLRPGDLRCLGS